MKTNATGHNALPCAMFPVLASSLRFGRCRAISGKLFPELLIIDLESVTAHTHQVPEIRPIFYI